MVGNTPSSFYQIFESNMEDVPIAASNMEDLSIASSNIGDVPIEEVPIASSNVEDIPMSKSKLKKLKREQQFEAHREGRKIKRKEKLQQKKQRKRAARDMGTTIDPETSVTANGDSIGNDSPEGNRRRLQQSVQLPVTIIIDCGFDDLMLDKERKSLASQLTRCYSDNNKAPFNIHLAISSFGGHLKDRFDTVLSGNHLKWKDVRILHEDFVEVAKQSQDWMKGDRSGKLAGALVSKIGIEEHELRINRPGEVVYLTSDSPNTLTELMPYSTYIIGGLVDRNRHKGICYKRAMDRGVKTAKLPIGDYMQMASRFVLATNHVSEIMLRWLELGDWGEAFERVVPKRKGGVLKSKLGGATGREGRHTISDDGNGDVEAEEEDRAEVGEQEADEREQEEKERENGK